jgi:hypothetical protein
MHTAVLTGALPIMDLNGQPTGEFQKVEVRDRMKMMTDLVNKAMPDRVEAPMLPEDNKASTVDVRNLSIEELEALANATSHLTLTSCDVHGPGNSGNPGTETPLSELGTPEAEARPLHPGVHE